MSFPHFARSGFACACALALPLMLQAAKTDLSRVTPVPAGETIPIADFFRPSLIRHASLNESGSTLAAIVSDDDDRSNLMLYDMTKKTANILRGFNRMEIGGFSWLDDNSLTYTIVKDKLYGYGLFFVNAKDLSVNYPLLQGCAIRYLGNSDKTRLEPLVWISNDPFNGAKDTGVHRINTKVKAGELFDWSKPGLTSGDVSDARESNDKHILTSYPQLGEGNRTSGYFLDKDGDLQFAARHEDGVPKLYHLENDSWKLTPLNLDDNDIISVGNQKTELLVSGPKKMGKPAPLVIVDGVTGQVGARLYQDDGYDFAGYPYRDPDTHEIIGLYINRGYPRVVWFTDSYKTIQKKLETVFPKQFVRIISSNRAQNLFLVTTESDQSPTVFHWLDINTNAMGLIKNSRPWIDATRMQPMRIFKFPTRDGYKLDAYLTLPAGASKEKPAPLIVLPHGGPWARDSWGFNPEVQFLASRGYAVIQPNYRGSTGFDWMYSIEDKWDFIKMQNDVSDCTKAILATGLIDTDRVAIMGASFGAYHAIAGAEETPCPYRCAVALSGVFDWDRVMKRLKRDRFDDATYSYMMRFLGDPDKVQARNSMVSPIKHLDKVHIPVFISHGRDDRVAEVTESKALASGLKERGVPHELLLFSEEGHGTQNIDNTVQLYSRIEAFLNANLKPRTAR